MTSARQAIEAAANRGGWSVTADSAGRHWVVNKGQTQGGRRSHRETCASLCPAFACFKGPRSGKGATCRGRSTDRVAAASARAWQRSCRCSRCCRIASWFRQPCDIAVMLLLSCEAGNGHGRHTAWRNTRRQARPVPFSNTTTTPQGSETAQCKDWCISIK